LVTWEAAKGKCSCAHLGVAVQTKVGKVWCAGYLRV